MSLSCCPNDKPNDRIGVPRLHYSLLSSLLSLSSLSLSVVSLPPSPLQTGAPAVTVPAGLTEGEGLPVSLEFLGVPDSDERLLTIARAFQELYQLPFAPKLTKESL